MSGRWALRRNISSKSDEALALCQASASNTSQASSRASAHSLAKLGKRWRCRYEVLRSIPAAWQAARTFPELRSAARKRGRQTSALTNLILFLGVESGAL